VGAEWLGWIRRLQAIAQSGLTYAKDPHDVERYEQVRTIAAEVAASRSEATAERIDALFCEESGYEVRAVRLLALWDRDKHPPLPFHVYKLCFGCELLDGDPLVAGTETDGVGFFRKDALPEPSLGRVTPRQIEGSSSSPPTASERLRLAS
jgi:hypothetical protein